MVTRFRQASGLLLAETRTYSYTYTYTQASRTEFDRWRACVAGVLGLVCLCVYDYSRTTGYEAAYERYQQLQRYIQGLEKQNGDSAETTAIENEKPARSRATLRGPAQQLAMRMRIIRGPPRGAHECVYRCGLRRPGLASSGHSGGMCVQSSVTARYPLIQLACDCVVSGEKLAPSTTHGPAHIRSLHQRYNARVEGLHFSAFHYSIDVHV